MLVVDRLADGMPAGAVLSGVALLLGINLTREAVAATGNWLTWRVRLSLSHDLLGVTVARLSSLPLSFHQRESVAGDLTRVDRGVTGFVAAFAEVLTTTLPAFGYLGLSLFFMLRLDWRLSLLVLAFAPVPAIIGMLAAPAQVQRDRTLLERWSRIFSRLHEVLAGIVTVKSFVMEAEEKRRFVNEVGETNRIVGRGVGVDSAVGAARNGVAALARAAALAAGAFLVLRGELTLGALLAFQGYVGGLFGPVQGLTTAYQTVRRASVSLDTIYDILDTPDPLDEVPGARDLVGVRGDVHFADVVFGYSNERPILRGVTLRVARGETVALVGRSGSGKSTLMALLQRLYDPTQGSIRIDGRDLRTLRQQSLRRHIGVVLQDCLLFNDTIRENIAYGRPGASDAEIEGAARAANAHDFVERLPGGYDTVVGERGGRLSVGERQRIAIARVLLKDPSILILDEATSALDAESEALVQEALERLVRGRTTFVIAHRLSTVVDADRIIVLRDGCIVEMGTHPELVRANGEYTGLFERQLAGLARAASAA